MAKISIIVPIFNSEQSLKACVESVRHQTFKEWELLLIDDGSQDSSLDICRKFAQIDSRIRVFHQQNSGVSVARMKGFVESTGEYLAFLDSDDTLPYDALMVLYGYMQDTYDMVIGALTNVVASGESVVKEHYGIKNGVIDSSEQFALALLNGQINPYLWGALYKRCIFRVSDFQTIIRAKLKIGEDWCLKLLCSRRVNKVKIVENVIYEYVENPNGTMNNSVMSYSYIDKVALVLNTFRNNFPKEISEELDSHFIADKIRCFFQPELPFSLKEYRLLVAYLADTFNENIIKKTVLPRYLRFIHLLPLYYFYTRLYGLLYKIVKLKGRKRNVVN